MERKAWTHKEVAKAKAYMRVAVQIGKDQIT